MELKIIASRSPCTALSPYQISWNLPSCSKNISRGHADRQLDRQTHRETGDLISLFSLLASRLKCSNTSSGEALSNYKLTICATLCTRSLLTSRLLSQRKFYGAHNSYTGRCLQCIFIHLPNHTTIQSHTSYIQILAQKSTVANVI
jgi:hypothetical protein